MKKLRHCVYILYSLKDKKFYIGYTENLKRRLTEHFKGNSGSTHRRKPFLLIFCEYFLSKKDALRREKYFKTNKCKSSLKQILRESLSFLKHEFF